MLLLLEDDPRKEILRLLEAYEEPAHKSLLLYQ